jgi:hypothetical protein
VEAAGTRGRNGMRGRPSRCRSDRCRQCNADPGPARSKCHRIRTARSDALGRAARRARPIRRNIWNGSFPWQAAACAHPRRHVGKRQQGRNRA